MSHLQLYVGECVASTLCGIGADSRFGAERGGGA